MACKMMLSLTFHSIFDICCHLSVEKVFCYLVHSIFHRIKTVSCHPCCRVPQLLHPTKNKHSQKVILTGLPWGNFFWGEEAAVHTQATKKTCLWGPLHDAESMWSLEEDFLYQKKRVLFLSQGCIVTFQIPALWLNISKSAILAGNNERYFHAPLPNPSVHRTSFIYITRALTKNNCRLG